MERETASRFTIRQTGWTAAKQSSACCRSFRDYFAGWRSHGFARHQAVLEARRKIPTLVQGFQWTDRPHEGLRADLLHGGGFAGGRRIESRADQSGKALFDRLLAGPHQDLKRQAVTLDRPR